MLQFTYPVKLTRDRKEIPSRKHYVRPRARCKQQWNAGSKMALISLRHRPQSAASAWFLRLSLPHSRQRFTPKCAGSGYQSQNSRGVCTSMKKKHGACSTRGTLLACRP